MKRFFGRASAAPFALAALSLLPLPAFAQGSASATASTSSSTSAVAPVRNACQRFAPGSVVQNGPALFSKNGVLNVQFSYQTVTDSVGRQLFCFMTPSGLENPTLHVNPGDTLNVTVTNNTPQITATTTEVYNAPTCGNSTEVELNAGTSAAGTMTGGSMNIHYHGTNTTPACHGDNVVKTLVNPGMTFSYSLNFPSNEPPGLYWYHPHVHGLAEAAVQGGAAGAIVVDGIQNVQPATSGLRQRVLVIRDQQTSQGLTESPGGTPGGIPQVDVTVNNISTNATTNTTTGVTTYTPAVINNMEPNSTEFWRISNSGSNVILDLEVVFDGTPQTVQIVGIDGVPVNSQDGTQPGTPISVTHFRMPPASRYEILVNAPSSSVKSAQLITQNIQTGPVGDEDPERPLITMSLESSSGRTASTAATASASSASSTSADAAVPASTGQNNNQQMFGGIRSQKPALTRTVFFEEEQDGSAFFINAAGCVTAAGAQCATQVTNGVPIDTVFDTNNPPSIITTQGTVEKWIVQNHAQENHELHQHQIHFLVLEQDNFEANGSTQAPAIDGQFLDMIEVPFCNGPPPAGVNPPACVNANGQPAIPYPQVQLLMDFRGPDVGFFVFHCHILGHEDLGMMGIEEVVAPATTN
jgi:FtsP/CotA-like multicopper oxidase with cupredoxin domain